MNYSGVAGVLCVSAVTLFASCKKNDHGSENLSRTITIENVLDSRPLVQSGSFMGAGDPHLIVPGETINIRFSAAKGEALSFATMYGGSNDLFFAPENPGIEVYDADGNPIEGDVSSNIKLWDNGTRINQAPGAGIMRPGTADSQNIAEVNGTDAQGNTYLEASKLVQAILTYEGNSYFTLALTNTSGGTANETALSPGVWAVSYIAGGSLLSPAPLYSEGQPTANGLTDIAEKGNNEVLSAYLTEMTGIFTPLSPILVVIYNGIENPIYMNGENDRMEGLKELAQKGNADILAAYLKTKAGVKEVYVLAEPKTKILLPAMGDVSGGKVSQSFKASGGDRLAIATMYGFSNDWFFSSTDNGVEAIRKGDISNTIELYDNGTAINQFPGAGITQFNLAGTPLEESMPIAPVPNPNMFTTLPAIKDMIRVKID